MAMSRVPYEYDGGILYMQGECGLCQCPFTVSLGNAASVNSAQQCIDVNGCPKCVRRIRNINVSRRFSTKAYYLSRHCGNLGCGALFRVSGLPRSGEDQGMMKTMFFSVFNACMLDSAGVAC